MTSEALTFLAAPTVMCLILAVMHCYLGIHVLSRGVVFVDLSLAQVASFGATLALLIDPSHHSHEGYLISLTATFLAAGLFALARRHERWVSQEAVIGIVFALASALVVLTIDRLAHGAEHLKEAMIGQILWVGWPEVLQTALIYSAVGLVHFIFRRQFLRASTEEGAHGIWDFLFYALFGVVITSSTHIAGVLMVFSFLIVPAVVSAMYFKTVRNRLIFGWALSTFLSFVGMYASWKMDAPVGAVMVVTFTSVPLLLLVVRSITGAVPTAKRNPKAA